MAFDFLKKKGVPDVGAEEVEEVITDETAEGDEPVSDEPEKKPSKEGGVASASVASAPVSASAPIVQPGVSQSELGRVDAKVEAVSSLIKSYGERFTSLGQQVGEVRAMNLGNEKSISKLAKDALKVIDIVKTVQPDKLRLDYQRADMKITALTEKIDANRQFSKTMMDEVKDIRKKAAIFLGTDALLKLNEDVKKDLVNIQKLSGRVRLNADKVEQLFIEVRKDFAESQKLNQVFNNLDTSYAVVQKDVEKLKVDHSNVVSMGDFNKYKKVADGKMIAVESTFAGIGKVSEENQRLAQLLETTLAVAKTNEQDIAGLAVTVGNDNVKGVEDYENKFNSILEVVGTLAEEVASIKKALNVKSVKKPEVKGVVEPVEKKEIVKSVEKKPSEEIGPVVEKEQTKLVKSIVKKQEVKKPVEAVNQVAKPVEVVKPVEVAKPVEKKQFFKKIFRKKGVEDKEFERKDRLYKQQGEKIDKSQVDKASELDDKFKSLHKDLSDLKGLEDKNVQNEGVKIKKVNELDETFRESVKKIEDLKSGKGEVVRPKKIVRVAVKKEIQKEETPKKTEEVLKEPEHEKKSHRKKLSRKDKKEMLKNLEKARRVRQKNLRHENHIKKERLKNLEKARKARSKSLKKAKGKRKK